MEKSLRIAPNMISLLERCIRDAGDREFCALLLQHPDGQQEVIRLPNWSEDRFAFFVSTSELRRIERFASRVGAKVLAFIHSHISSLDLSDTDQEYLHHSKYNWVVVIMQDGSIRTKVYEKGMRSLETHI